MFVKLESGVILNLDKVVWIGEDYIRFSNEHYDQFEISPNDREYLESILLK